LIRKVRFPKIFFGWWTVLATGILGFWVAGFHVYGMSALFLPISSDLGFSRVQTAIPTSIGRLQGGIEGPVAGLITDRFGPRCIVLIGILMVGLSLILMNYVNSLWSFIVVWGILLGTAHNISTTLPVYTVISNWFVKKRGLALGIQNVMNGSSGLILLPFIAWLIIAQGWQTTCVIGGVVILVVGLPLTWFFLKPRRPEYYGLLPDGAKTEEQEIDVSQAIDKGVMYAAEAEEVEFTLRQSMRTSTLWMMVIAHSIQVLAISAVNIHTIPLLTDMGIEPLKASAIMASSYVAASLPVRFVGGLLADRLKKNHLRFLMSGAYLIGVLGFTFFLKNQTVVGIYVFLTLFGICKGASMVPFSAILGRYYGRKALGSIRGFSQMLMAPFGIVAPIVGGWVYDKTGSYQSALIWVTVLLAFATVLMAITRPPKPPARITDINERL
jgi:MFS family permease